MEKKAKIELLAPAGSMEKLKYAIHYGADAVYCGIPDISMRARVNSFTKEDISIAADYVHERGKKIFVTINIYAHNYHLLKVEKHLKFLSKIKIDGVIISDFGILELVKKYLPKVDIHISTQANITNWRAAKFWHDLGAKRIVLAREVTLEDIKEIHRKLPKLELEYFVHGAMCMSYSGRCILSKWMSGKSANLGDCSQPCRWGYKQVTSDKLQITNMEIQDVRGEHNLELEEDDNGTYFFNSKDLNLINHLAELSAAGVKSFKIEGRNKSVSYVSSVVRAYREVVDSIERQSSTKEIEKITKKQEKDLNKIMNRGYTEGFLLENEPEHNFKKSHEDVEWEFVGEFIENLENGNKKNILNGLIKIKPHNAIRKNDRLQIMGRLGDANISIDSIYNDKGVLVESAHGGQGRMYYIKLKRIDAKIKSLIEEMSLLRKEISQE